MAEVSIYNIALSMAHGLAPEFATVLASRLGSVEAFFDASESTLMTVAGKRLSVFDKIQRDQLLERAKVELEFIDRYNIKTLYYTDPDYPERLAQCEDAPLMLYAKGNCDLNTSHIVSIVGTRHATPYGIDFVKTLVNDLESRIGNLIIVSGLAYGTDICAHRAAIDCNVPTAAVLAHGLNRIYPAMHRQVADNIARTAGTLVTEYTTSSHISRANFLSRNRIIAGLADCTIVVESDLKGGSLVTAHAANEYNREVFALPGRITDRYSRGTNDLVAKNQAHIVTCADDILDMMGWKPRPVEGDQGTLPIQLNPTEQSIHDLLAARGELCINDISTALNIPIHEAMSTLVDMEFAGVIVALPGARYRI